MGENEKNDLILQIIKELKNDNNIDKITQVLERIAILETRDLSREEEIDNLKKFNEKKEEKEGDLKKFNFTKLFTILSFGLAFLSLLISIYDKF